MPQPMIQRVLFEDIIILIKGAGEKASAVAHRLRRAGFRKIVMTDLPAPLAERRAVSFCEALIDGQKEVCGVLSRKAEPSIGLIHRLWSEGVIPVVAEPESKTLRLMRPNIFIDAVMAKRNTGTRIDCAPLVIALGPGFTAGVDAHYVVETNPASPRLGQAIAEGMAEQNTDTPTPVFGLTRERLIWAPAGGILSLLKQIGERITRGEELGHVGSVPVKSEIGGTVWGLLRDGMVVVKGQKIGDIDPRGEPDLCFEIAPQAKTVAEGVLRAIARFYGGQ